MTVSIHIPAVAVMYKAQRRNLPLLGFSGALRVVADAQSTFSQKRTSHEFERFGLRKITLRSITRTWRMSIRGLVPPKLKRSMTRARSGESSFGKRRTAVGLKAVLRGHKSM